MGRSVNITGSGIVDPDGEFDVGNFTGTIDGFAIDPTQTNAGGAVLGGKANGVGGTWAAHGASDIWATGEFHGKR